MKRLIQVFLACLSIIATTAIAENSYSEMIVFGDSLSDPGNAFVLTGSSSVRPFDAGNIPSAAYAIGGHHFSNGETWSEHVSKSLHLHGGNGPALRSPEFSNYAFGGARARPAAGGPFDLNAQLGAYFANTGGNVDGEALYVLFFGGN